MTSVLAFLGTKLGLFSSGAILSLVLAVAHKQLPLLVAKYFGNALEKQLHNIDSIKDPVFRQLVFNWAVDSVKIAEYLMPNTQGSDKFHFVAEQLCKFFPLLNGRQEALEELIEDAVTAMKAEMENAVKVVK